MLPMITPETDPTMPDAPSPGSREPVPSLPRDPGAGSEKYKERGVILRVFV
jgi:hypothetical protein